MNAATPFLRSLWARSIQSNAAQCCSRSKRVASQSSLTIARPAQRPFSSTPCRRAQKSPDSENANFVSIVDLDPTMVRSGRKHGPGLILLGSSLSLRNYTPSKTNSFSLSQPSSQSQHSPSEHGKCNAWAGKQTS
jgi:hypothetical protein